jgi:hypothetical protein
VPLPRHSEYPVRGLASIPEVCLLSLHGLGMQGVTGTRERMFGALARNRINVSLITQASSEYPSARDKARRRVGGGEGAQGRILRGNKFGTDSPACHRA